MDKYKFTLETKNGISESKSNSVFDYLKIIADQVGLFLKKEVMQCQQKSSQSQTPQEK